MLFTTSSLAPQQNNGTNQRLATCVAIVATFLHITGILSHDIPSYHALIYRKEAGYFQPVVLITGIFFQTFAAIQNKRLSVVFNVIN